MSDSVAKHYLEDSISSFRAYKKLAERAIEQVTDEEFFRALDEEANSIAVIVKHMAGNMLSRWTDFLTTDGEKPDRNRDMEFVITPQTTRAEMLEFWEEGWRCTFDAIEALKPEDAMRKVLIRGKEHTVIEAINRQQTHYSYHIGQIVFLAKHFKSAGWKSLSIPRNKSADFNAYLADKASEDKRPAHRFDAAQEFIQQQETGDRSQESEEKKDRG
ncbi:MAG: DUF1572 domain-containing protein [Acidobacteriota bacterium]|nr:DUF1572 domain-containing protein [Acidobacteriota bacterium]